jgi:hypothetical protein
VRFSQFQESDIFGEYDVDVWRFDPSMPQKYISSRGLDAYPGWIQNARPFDFKKCIHVNLQVV